MFPGLFNSTCSVTRDAPVQGSTNGRTAPQQMYASVPCMVEPMGSRAAIENEFQLGHAYNFYFGAGEDVRVGDQLGYNGSTFAVKYLKPYAGFGPTSYVQALTEQEIS